jgi:hypothetical protein
MSDFSTWVDIFNDPQVHENFKHVERLTLNTYYKESETQQPEELGEDQYVLTVNRNSP